MTDAARRLLVPGISTVAMLAILIGLGTWQVERLHWKQGILDRVAAAEQNSPVPLAGLPNPFTKVVARGTFRPDMAALYGAEVRDAPNGGSVLGGQLIEPLIRPGQPPLLVDRGWVPDDRRAEAARSDGEVSVAGYVREADHPGWFSATDDVTGRRFYTLDPAAIGRAVGLPEVVSYTLVALGDPPPGTLPDPARRLPRPPNNHLQYALTWYGFAVTLAVIFTLYARKALRSEV